MDKRSGDDDSNKYPMKLKRSSGWARKNETDKTKIKSYCSRQKSTKIKFWIYT
jgi:hypothetical protein